MPAGGGGLSGRTPPPTPNASSLYVGGLDARVCTELLHDIFSLAGEVTLCRVVSDKHTRASLGFGFVDYPDHASAVRAQQLLHGRILYGHELTVDWAHANSNAAAGRGSGSHTHDRVLGSAAAEYLSHSGPKSGGHHNGRRMVGPDGVDISNHYCLFIGNLDSSVTDEDLRTAFSAFGHCSSAQVSRDSSSNSRRCAFVSFTERSAAQAAIDGLNGQVIASRPVRVDWARSKTNAVTRAAALGLPDVVDTGCAGDGAGKGAGARESGSAGSAGEEDTGGIGSVGNGVKSQPVLEYSTILGQAPPSFATVYVTGLPLDVDDSALRSAFEAYGTVTEVRIPESARSHSSDKMYAFVVYAEHESAARAIYHSQVGLVVAGRHVSTQWGRENHRGNSGRRGQHGWNYRNQVMQSGSNRQNSPQPTSPPEAQASATAVATASASLGSTLPNTESTNEPIASSAQTQQTSGQAPRAHVNNPQSLYSHTPEPSPRSQGPVVDIEQRHSPSQTPDRSSAQLQSHFHASHDQHQHSQPQSLPHHMLQQTTAAVGNGLLSATPSAFAPNAPNSSSASLISHQVVPPVFPSAMDREKPVTEFQGGSNHAARLAPGSQVSQVASLGQHFNFPGGQY